MFILRFFVSFLFAISFLLFLFLYGGNVNPLLTKEEMIFHLAIVIFFVAIMSNFFLLKKIKTKNVLHDKKDWLSKSQSFLLNLYIKIFLLFLNNKNIYFISIYIIGKFWAFHSFSWLFLSFERIHNMFIFVCSFSR